MTTKPGEVYRVDLGMGGKVRLRLENKMPVATTPHVFRTYAATEPDSRTWGEINRVADEEQEAHNLAKLNWINPVG